MRLGRPLGLGAALAAGLTLVACGPEIPTDASVEDFCKAGDTFSTATEFDAGVKAADRLHDTGTPKDIPDTARDGFELVVELVTGSEDKADLEKRYDELSDADKATVEALDAYIAKIC